LNQAVVQVYLDEIVRHNLLPLTMPIIVHLMPLLSSLTSPIR